MVVIIDDREDVWNFAPNLIHVRPYHFFQHTGDINAPPGLTKQEKDDKEGFDFSALKDKTNNSEDPKEKIKFTDESNLTGDQDKTEENFSHDAKSEAKIDGSPPIACTIYEEADVKMENTNAPTETTKISEMAEESPKQSDGNADVAENPKTHESSQSPGENSDVEITEVSETDAKDINLKPVEENGSNETTPSKEEDENQSKESKIHVNDPDDYLLYLEEILRTVHHAYYEMYDICKKNGDSDPIPDMKIVLPYVRRKVLENVRVVFSGLIPTNAKLDKSRPYLVAKSLGAVVEDKVTENTTHIVAARLGTSKVIYSASYW